MIKTNKSYTKRLKITRNGKILSRHAGQDHFNSRERGPQKSRKSGYMSIQMDNKSKSRFLANI